MPRIYSNHFNSSGSVGPGQGALTEELPLNTERRATGVSHSRYRHSHAIVTVGTVAGIGDEIRMLTLKSSDRIYSILCSSDGAATAGDADLGLYLVGDDHDGALPSANCVDCFSTTPNAIDTAQDRVEVRDAGDYNFNGAGGTADGGKQLWELINISDASTYAADPHLQYDLTFTVTVAVTVAAVTLQLEVFYTSND